jgi:hypothetical protein
MGIEIENRNRDWDQGKVLRSGSRIGFEMEIEIKNRDQDRELKDRKQGLG